MDAKDNRWKMVHSIKKHMMIIQNVINFRFMNYSPFVFCGFLFDQVVFRCGNNENLLQFIEIYSRCNISGPGQVIRIHFHFTDVSDKKSLKEPVTDMRCNNLFSDFNLIIIIGKFFKTDPAVFPSVSSLL